MSKYIEYNDKIAFHPGYYLKEIVEASGLTQEDFAKCLGTTPKNLSILIRGEQNLSIDIAAKLSRMLGTSVNYWLNLQQTYDAMQADFISSQELIKEREVFKLIEYKYFRENFGLPAMPRNIDEQIRCVREFLRVSSLSVLKEKDLAVSFRSYSDSLSQTNIVNANVMVQIAINRALRTETSKFDRKKFERAVNYALTQTTNHSGFLPHVKKAFSDAGVVLVVLPNLSRSGINGATKKLGSKVLLMVNDRRKYADTFWFTMFHEIGHIMNGDYGITFKDNKNSMEDEADLYAQRKLVPQVQYEEFVSSHKILDEKSIKAFAESINRDPGIVLGRLQNDGLVSYSEKMLTMNLRHKYKVSLI